MTFQDNCGGCGNFDKCDYEDPYYGLVCPRDTRTAPLAPKPDAKTEEGLDIFGSGKIDPLRHSDKCPASKGGPICTCGGNYGI